MKSKLLFGFAVVAAFAAVLVSGCSSSDSTPTNNCISINGNIDTGFHTVYANTLALPLSGIEDTLTATVSGSSATVVSNALGFSLTGTVNCNSVALDSVIFGPNDTLRVASQLVAGGVKIWNVRAGGTATITSTGVSTVINVVKGNTNISSPIDLTNITPSLGLNLKGNFKKTN